MSKLLNILAEIDHRVFRVGSELHISGGEIGIMVNQTPDNFEKAGEPFSRSTAKIVYKVTHSKDRARIGTLQVQYESRIYLKESTTSAYRDLFSELDDEIRLRGYRLEKSGYPVTQSHYTRWVEEFFRNSSVVPVSMVPQMIRQFMGEYPLATYAPDVVENANSSVHVGNEESDLFTKVYARVWDGKYQALNQYRSAVTDAINRASGYGGDLDMAQLVDLYIKQYPFVVAEARSENARSLTSLIAQAQDSIIDIIPRPSVSSDIKQALRSTLGKLDAAFALASQITEDDVNSDGDEYIDEDDQVVAEPTEQSTSHPLRDLDQPEESSPNLDWLSNFDIKEVKNAIDEIVSFLASCDDDTQIELLRNDIRILDNLATALKSRESVDQHWEIATQQGSCEHLHPEFVSKMNSALDTNLVREAHDKKKAATFSDHKEWTDAATTREMDIKPGKDGFEGAYCGTSGKLVGMWKNDKGWIAPVVKESIRSIDETTKVNSITHKEGILDRYRINVGGMDSHQLNQIIDKSNHEDSWAIKGRGNRYAEEDGSESVGFKEARYRSIASRVLNDYFKHQKSAPQSKNEGTDTSAYPPIVDDKGVVIKAGDDIVWSERGYKQTGTVIADPKYTGGLKVGGRSLKNIYDSSKTLKVV
jgi:hypothetical protein